MVKVNIALVRLLQFVVFVLFTFMVLAYFGAMVLVPLDLVVLMIKIMGVVGINDLFAAVVVVPVVGYLCLIAYKQVWIWSIPVSNGLRHLIKLPIALKLDRNLLTSA